MRVNSLLVLVLLVVPGCANPCNDGANYPTAESRGGCNVDRQHRLAGLGAGLAAAGQQAKPEPAREVTCETQCIGNLCHSVCN